MAFGGNPQRGLNWRRFAGVALTGFIVSASIAASPMLRCTFSGMDDVSIGTLAGTDIDDMATNSSDVARANQTSGFIGGFFGTIGMCYSAYPVHAAGRSSVAALGFLIALFVFRFFDREQYKRRIRHASSGYRIPEKPGSNKRRG